MSREIQSEELLKQLNISSKKFWDAKRGSKSEEKYATLNDMYYNLLTNELKGTGKEIGYNGELAGTAKEYYIAEVE